MMTFNITRVLRNEWGTFSVLACEQAPIGNVLEPIKPIPSGSYVAIYSYHPKHKYAYELQLVPGHTGILIHKGNWKEDTKGCLIPGLFMDKIWKGPRQPLTWQWGVGSSGAMIKKIMDITKGAVISIDIKEAFYQPDLQKAVV
jgi:hypothetical protein